jgi:hypothetical protein
MSSSFRITRKNGDTYSVLVDDADLERVMYAGPWHIRAPDAQHRSAYVVRRHNGKLQKLHRFLLDPAPGVQVDHIDGNGLNNQRSNLRLCSGSQNQGNISKKRTNKSGYKGAHFHKGNGRWKAQISVQNKNIHLGYFDTPEAAHEAYQRAAVQYFGDYAHFG